MVARTDFGHSALTLPSSEALSFLPPTPVSLIATQCLSQIPAAPVDSTTVKLLFKLKQISFSADNTEEDVSIQQTLSLSDSESTLLNAIVEKWVYLKEMPLHNIFGVSIFDKITSLSSEIDEETYRKISKQFSAYFFDTYLRLERDSVKLASQNVAFQNSFIPTWPVIKRRLEMVLEAIKLRCPIRSTRDKVITKKQVRFREKTLVAITSEIDLFIKFYENEHGKTILARQSMHSSFVDRATVVTDELNDIKLGQLNCYARFVHSMVTYTHKEEECLFFEKLCQHLPLLKGDNLIEGVKVLQSDLNDSFDLIAKEQLKLERTIQDLRADKLTHAQWAANHDIQPDHILCKGEFMEQMLFHVTFFFKVDFFVGQFQKCFEQEIVRPAFPDFASSVNHIQRFLYNIRSCTKIPIPHHSHPLTISYQATIDSFGKKFSKKIEALELFFVVLLNDPMFIKLSGSDFNVLISDLYSTRGIWLCKLSKFNFVVPLLESAKTEMQQAISALNKDFKEGFDNIKDLPENDKQVIVEDIQTFCREQCLFLIRLVMVAEDISAVLRGDFSFNPQHIPVELVNLMHLDAFDEFLAISRRGSTCSQGRGSMSSQDGSGESLPEKKERRYSQQLLSIYDLDLERRDSQNGKLQQEEKVKKETDLEAIKLAARTRKTYKILDALKKEGYKTIPGKHKHIKLCKKGEPHVTLPRALEQGTGMSFYIRDMLGDSIHLVERPKKEK